MSRKSHGAYWDKLRREVNQKPLTAHPVFADLVKGKLKHETIAELCAQLKYTVLDGIGSLALIVPQAPRDIKRELGGNLFGELTGTKREPSHWELALRAGAAAGFSEKAIDKRPMLPETKIYPDTVSAYAIRGMWLEALSFVALGIEDLFPPFCDGVAKGLKKHYGFDDRQTQYFTVHVGADEVHSDTGWEAARTYCADEAQKQRIRRAALEGRNMWWNMYSAVYRKGEGKEAPVLRLDA